MALGMNPVQGSIGPGLRRSTSGPARNGQLALPMPSQFDDAGSQTGQSSVYIPQSVNVTEDFGAEPADPAQPKFEGFELQRLVEWFEDAEEITQNSRYAAERDRDYYDNKQLTPQEKAILSKRGQPDVIINRVQTKVNYLLGYEATQRSDPMAYPRTPDDEEASEAATDGLRYVADKAVIARPFSQVWENMLIEGFGGLEVVPRVLEGDNDGMGDADFDVKTWHWDRLFFDPYSRDHDFADARYLGGVIWLDEEEALRLWPDGEEAITTTIDGDLGKTYDDRPAWRRWAASGRRRRIRICQMYYLKGDTWAWCIFTKSGKLEEGEVPYRDEDNKSLCPMVMQSAFVDRDNNRYGFVRALIGPQDEINKRRSKMLHEASVRQFMYEKGAVDDVDVAKQELARPDGAVEVNPDMKFELLDRSKEIAAHTALQQEAKNEIDLMGPNAAMQGKGDKDSSGRAILANQQGGQIEISILLDRHKHLKMRTYKLIWAMIRMYWKSHKWIRVTDDEKKTKFVGLNQPVTLAEKLLEEAEKRGIPLEDAKAAIKQAVAQNPQIQAELEQVVDMKHVPADMTMDIILEEVPDTANIQQEQFEMMVKLAQAGVQFPPKVYIAASALRNKRELIEMLEEQNQQDPNAAAAAQLTLDKAKTEIQKMLSEIEKNKAASVKTLAEADMLDAQIGQVVNPRIVEIGNGMHQMPDGSIMQGNEHGQLSPVAPAVDPNQEAQRAFDAQQRDVDRQVGDQSQQRQLGVQTQHKQMDLQARDQSQQAEIAARQQAQQSDIAAQREQAAMAAQQKAKQTPLNEVYGE
jgi:hypothetical protein